MLLLFALSFGFRFKIVIRFSIRCYHQRVSPPYISVVSALYKFEVYSLYGDLIKSLGTHIALVLQYLSFWPIMFRTVPTLTCNSLAISSTVICRSSWMRVAMRVSSAGGGTSIGRPTVFSEVRPLSNFSPTYL